MFLKLVDLQSAAVVEVAGRFVCLTNTKKNKKTKKLNNTHPPKIYICTSIIHCKMMYMNLWHRQTKAFIHFPSFSSTQTRYWLSFLFLSHAMQKKNHLTVNRTFKKKCKKKEEKNSIFKAEIRNEIYGICNLNDRLDFAVMPSAFHCETEHNIFNPHMRVIWIKKKNIFFCQLNVHNKLPYKATNINRKKRKEVIYAFQLNDFL